MGFYNLFWFEESKVLLGGRRFRRRAVSLGIYGWPEISKSSIWSIFSKNIFYLRFYSISLFVDASDVSFILGLWFIRDPLFSLNWSSAK